MKRFLLAAVAVVGLVFAASQAEAAPRHGHRHGNHGHHHGHHHHHGHRHHHHGHHHHFHGYRPYYSAPVYVYPRSSFSITTPGFGLWLTR